MLRSLEQTDEGVREFWVLQPGQRVSEDQDKRSERTVSFFFFHLVVLERLVEFLDVEIILILCWAWCKTSKIFLGFLSTGP